MELRAPGGAGAGRSPAAADPGPRRRVAGRAERPFRGFVLGSGSAFDPGGDAAAGHALTDVLLGALRADGDGRLAPDGVHPQPRPAAGDGGGLRLPVGTAGAQTGQAVVVE